MLASRNAQCHSDSESVLPAVLLLSDSPAVKNHAPRVVSIAKNANALRQIGVHLRDIAEGRISMVSVDDWPLDGSIENLLDGVPTLGGNLDGLNLQLRKAEMRIRQEQIRVANRANQLSQALIESNERASKQNEENAKQMNFATQALARSTSWLKWATWALVAFTAIQAVIAFAALVKK